MNGLLVASLLTALLGGAPFSLGTLPPAARTQVVRSLQGVLHDLGDPGLAATGEAGPATWAALRRFQLRHHLKATGRLNLPTALALVDALRRQGRWLPGLPDRPDLAPGQAGLAVALVQLALDRAGASVPITGLYDPATQAAVARLRAAWHLSPGHVDRAFWQRLSRGAALTPAGLPEHAFLAYGSGFMGSPSTASFMAHVGLITAYAPWGFALTAAGGVVQRGGGAVAPVVAFAHAHHRLVLPLFTNAWTNDQVLLSPAVRAKALADVVSTVVRDHLDGAVVDFEGLSQEDTAALTGFVADLSGLLHPLGKAVLVAVGPEWAGESPQWAVYDLHALGQVADRVLLMTYDEHANPGAPGPVAGLGWVSSALRYAMTQVSPARLLLGIADYGYDWSPGQAATVTAAQALALARQMGAAVAWDAVAQEPHFTYLQGTVRHTVWFEDGASAALKIALAQRDGLGGIALWQLGGEGPGFWNRIAAYRPAP